MVALMLTQAAVALLDIAETGATGIRILLLPRRAQVAAAVVVVKEAQAAASAFLVKAPTEQQRPAPVLVVLDLAVLAGLMVAAVAILLALELEGSARFALSTQAPAVSSHRLMSERLNAA